MHGGKTSTVASTDKDAPRMSHTTTTAIIVLAVAVVVQGTIIAAVVMAMHTHDLWAKPARPTPVATEMWAWGENGGGQLGIGDTEDRATPTEVTVMHDRRIHAVACGSHYTAAVVDGGVIWTTGVNKNGQLGLRDTWFVSTFEYVYKLSGRKVAAVACGIDHTLALLETGELLAWGSYKLGLGDKPDRTMPMSVTALSGRRVAAIACGAFHSVAVLETGELFVWGDNYNDQLGLGNIAYRNVPTQVLALAGKRVVAVACGSYHTVAVTESGELFTWGWNVAGRLGHGDITENKNTPQLVEAFRGRPVIAVACRWSHTLALLKTGEVFAWGSNKRGELGLGEFSEDPISTPQQVHFFDDKRVKSIHCGTFFSGAVLESGELFMWGRNIYGQLGTGDIESRATPTLVSGLSGKHVHSVALGTGHTIALVE